MFQHLISVLYLREPAAPVLAALDGFLHYPFGLACDILSFCPNPETKKTRGQYLIL